METAERLVARDLRRAMTCYSEALQSHRQAINRLNVFPVPDGDTGTNMALTVGSVVDALDEVVEGRDESMAAVGRAVSHGALMGARGNSGLILAQILRGVATTLGDLESAGPGELAGALVQGAEAARAAVTNPVEGTILTVARVAAEAAARAAGEGRPLVEVLEEARAAGGAALARTPEQLPALAQAGVVDAGGAGFVLLLDALLTVATGRPLPEPEPPVALARQPLDPGAGPPRTRPGDTTAAAAGDGAGEEAGGLRYEVMYLLEAPAQSIPAFKEVWAGLGDSIVVVGSGSLWNCHIHTDDIGPAVEAALDVGRPRSIRVTDLLEQVEEERWVRQAAGGTEVEPGWIGASPVTSVVAVANGDGIRRIFRSLGVDRIVAGGQSMNPSTAQLLGALEAAAADQVVLLPNNANIVPVAEQAAALSPKRVVVLPTPGVAEGFAALMEYDPQAGPDDNLRLMAAAAARVVTGQVTRAVRASDSPAGPIAEGDWLGLSGGAIEVVGSSLAEAACALLGKLCVDDHELVTLIEGVGARPSDTRRVTEWLAEHRPRAQAEVHHGGQPLYPYLISLE